MKEANNEEARRQSPCLVCRRVKDPQDCENKLCKEWQAWFIARWDAMRTNVLKSFNEPQQQADIQVGGTGYVHPDRVKAYLSCNPCQTCVFKAHCEAPCGIRKAWDERREKAGVAK